jgi:hypothetical protein
VVGMVNCSTKRNSQTVRQLLQHLRMAVGDWRARATRRFR